MAMNYEYERHIRAAEEAGNVKGVEFLRAQQTQFNLAKQAEIVPELDRKVYKSSESFIENMSSKYQKNPEIEKFLPLSETNLYTLLILLREPRHGYAILKEIEDLSEGRVKPGVGNLYVSLRRLENSGIIERVHNPQQPSRKKFYHVTELGTQVFVAEYLRLSRIQKVIEKGKLND